MTDAFQLDLSPDIRWPSIEAGLDWLTSQNILSNNQVQTVADSLGENISADFAAARQRFDANLRNLLSDSFASGDSRDQWRERLGSTVPALLSHAEAIGRTYSHRAYHEGLAEVLRSPAVAVEFPYFEYAATGDSRTRETHAAMDGKIAHVGSPLEKKMQALVAEYGCRCTMIPLSREDAVAKGIDDNTGWVEPPPGTQEDDEQILLFEPGEMEAINTLPPPTAAKPPIAAIGPPTLVPPTAGEPMTVISSPKPVKKPKTENPITIKVGDAKPKGEPIPVDPLIPQSLTATTTGRPVVGAFDTPVLAPRAVEKPKAKAKSTEKYRVVQKLGGSTGAEKVVDAKGKQYVRKFGASPEHVREEYAAEKLYRAAGVPVPASRLEKQDGKPVKLSEFINARPLGVLAGEDRQKADAAVRRHFAADALFGNWDVLGMDADNVLVTADGTVHRVDVGGSLRFRAQGGEKDFGEFPDELTTLRAPSRSAARIFGKLTNKELAEQIDDLQSRRKAILAAAPKELRPTLEKRLDNMKSIASLWRKEPDTNRDRQWDEIKSMMQSTKVRSKFPEITPIQKEAVEKYTGSAFESLNASLRENPTNPEFYPTGNLANPKEVHDALQGMFEKAGDLPKELIVYRGRRSVVNVDKAEALMHAGGTLTFEGYGSASFDPGVASQSFGPVVYEIVARKGIDLASLHGYKGIKLEYGQNESEILQNHGTKYKVVGIQRDVDGKLFGDDLHKKVQVIQLIQVE